ncbi:hypothetical protein F5I97DRAFT_1841860 [Phlebopus sp. FC_14]|nr:hypothetical protein F5I97DRAFT_1841860 [Phlebopus sp. FC_14]
MVGWLDQDPFFFSFLFFFFFGLVSSNVTWDCLLCLADSFACREFYPVLIVNIYNRYLHFITVCFKLTCPESRSEETFRYFGRISLLTGNPLFPTPTTICSLFSNAFSQSGKKKKRTSNSSLTLYGI